MQPGPAAGKQTDGRPTEAGLSGSGEELARLRRELSDTRATLAGLLEDAPLGVHRYRLQPDGRLEFLGGNRAADRILGASHAALVGLSIEEAFPPLASTRIPAGYRGVVETGQPYQDELFTYRDSRIDSVFDIAAFRTGSSEMAVFFRDVTAQRRAEEALRAKTEELDQYFRSSLDLLCIADTDGYFRRLNPEWEKALGWPMAELLGRRFLDLVHPDDMAGTLAAVSSLASQKEVLNFVNRYRCRDGGWRWIEWRSFPQGKLIYAVARDVTEQKRVEAALRESEGRLSSIFRASPVGIGLTVNRVIQEVNDAAAAMTGRARAELVGQSTRILYPDDAEFRRVGEELDAARGRKEALETRWVRRDGGLIDVLLSAAPFDLANPSAGITFTAVDVSERKRHEESRRALEARMRETQRLESLGILAGGIAHDFNNILMAILGHAELAQGELPPGSAALGSLGEIQEAARKASDLVRQMLAYAGKGRFRVEPLDLNRVIRETARMLEVSVSKKAELRLDLASSLPAVEVDVAQLRQVIMNLVINASEAIGDASGTITVATGRTAMDRSPAGGGWVDGDPPEGEYVTMDVADTGAGMDDAVKARIFDPFFTTKFTGRGLGLAAVIGIVRGHRGAIRVRSAPGRGTVFTVALPASARAVAAPRDPAEPVAWRGAGTVLLVDDEEAVRKVGGRMLEQLGFRVLCASNGREAVEVFRKVHGEIRCVIMDLSMPKMDGEETFPALRDIDPAVQVLLSSGYEAPEAVQRFSAEGLAGFIQKPYRMATLGEALRRVVGDAP